MTDQQRATAIEQLHEAAKELGYTVIAGEWVQIYLEPHRIPCWVHISECTIKKASA